MELRSEAVPLPPELGLELPSEVVPPELERRSEVLLLGLELQLEAAQLPEEH